VSLIPRRSRESPWRNTHAVSASTHWPQQRQGALLATSLLPPTLEAESQARGRRPKQICHGCARLHSLSAAEPGHRVSALLTWSFVVTSLLTLGLDAEPQARDRRLQPARGTRGRQLRGQRSQRRSDCSPSGRRRLFRRLCRPRDAPHMCYRQDGLRYR